MQRPPTLKSRVYEFCKKNSDKKKVDIVKHFTDEDFPASTVYRHISSYERGESPEHKKSSGRKPLFSTRASIKQLIEKFNHSMGFSQRKAARKLGCNQSTVCRILKTKTDVRFYKRGKKSRQTDKQSQSNRPKCRRLALAYKFTDFVLDDESYFTLSNSTLNGNSGYYSSDRNLTPDHIKNKYVSKFEQKLLVWCAGSAKGISKLVFKPSGQAVDQFSYLNSCLVPNLLPFLLNYHSDGNCI